MFLSREIDVELCQIKKKLYIYKNFCIKIVGLNRSYSANTQKSENLGLLLLSFEFNNFSFLIDIIDSIIII